MGLASAFAMDTPVIILDEPTQFQDTKGKQLVKTAMNEVLSKDKSILCITHDLELSGFKQNHLTASFNINCIRVRKVLLIPRFSHEVGFVFYQNL